MRTAREIRREQLTEADVLALADGGTNAPACKHPDRQAIPLVMDCAFPGGAELAGKNRPQSRGQALLRILREPPGNLGVGAAVIQNDLLLRDREDHPDVWKAIEAELAREATALAKTTRLHAHLATGPLPSPLPESVTAVLVGSPIRDTLVTHLQATLNSLDGRLRTLRQELHHTADPGVLARLQKTALRHAAYAARLALLGPNHPHVGPYRTDALADLLTPFLDLTAPCLARDTLASPWDHPQRSATIADLHAEKARITASLDRITQAVARPDAPLPPLGDIADVDAFLGPWVEKAQRLPILTAELAHAEAARDAARTLAQKAAHDAVGRLGGVETLVRCLLDAEALSEPAGPLPEVATHEAELDALAGKIRLLSNGHHEAPPPNSLLAKLRARMDQVKTTIKSITTSDKTARRHRAKALAARFLEAESSAMDQVRQACERQPIAFPEDAAIFLKAATWSEVSRRELLRLIDTCLIENIP